MNDQKNKYPIWLLGLTILLSCFIGIGFWLSADSIANSLAAKVSLDYSGQGNAVAQPEIDLRIPETTEIALFALG